MLVSLKAHFFHISAGKQSREKPHARPKLIAPHRHQPPLSDLRGGGIKIVGFQPIMAIISDCKLDSMVYAGVCVVI